MEDRNMNCETCLHTKTKWVPHKGKQQKYAPGEAFCKDILAPNRTETLNTEVQGPKHLTSQALYFITITDVATRSSYVTTLRSRDITSQVIDESLSKFATKLGRTPTRLITDNAGE